MLIFVEDAVEAISPMDGRGDRFGQRVQRCGVG
jgi:hypothetical protein